MPNESGANAIAEGLKNLGPECAHSLQIIRDSTSEETFGEIITRVAAIADSHAIDTRMILLSTSDTLSKLKGGENRAMTPKLISSDSPIHTSYKMFFLSQMVTDTIATPKLMQGILKVLIEAGNGEMEKAMLADNVFHAVLQVQRRFTAEVLQSQQAAIEQDCLKQVYEAAKWPRGTGLFSVARYPPLIFNKRGSDAETFSAEYAKAVIGNESVSKVLDKFRDPMLQASAAWNLVRLDKYIGQMELDPENKSKIMHDVAQNAIRSLLTSEQEAEKSMWLVASVAKIAKSEDVLRAACNLWSSIKEGASMEVISRYFTRILDYEKDPQRLSAIFSSLRDSDDPEKAAFAIKVRLETETK